MSFERPWQSPEYKKFRAAVRRRDGNRCRFPGCKQTKKLKVHHIKPWADAEGVRFCVDNGVTLCSTHHTQVTGHEAEYEGLFRSLINPAAMQLLMMRYGPRKEG